MSKLRKYNKTFDENWMTMNQIKEAYDEDDRFKLVY